MTEDTVLNSLGSYEQQSACCEDCADLGFSSCEEYQDTLMRNVQSAYNTNPDNCDPCQPDFIAPVTENGKPFYAPLRDPARTDDVVEMNPEPGAVVDGSDDESVDDTLNVRGNAYGDFIGQSFQTQYLKDFAREQSGWERMSYDQRESLDMIFSKIARLLNGDPSFVDSWYDIAGYATLIVNELTGKPSTKIQATRDQVGRAYKMMELAKAAAEELDGSA